MYNVFLRVRRLFNPRVPAAAVFLLQTLKFGWWVLLNCRAEVDFYFTTCSMQEIWTLPICIYLHVIIVNNSSSIPIIPSHNTTHCCRRAAFYYRALHFKLHIRPEFIILISISIHLSWTADSTVFLICT